MRSVYDFRGQRVARIVDEGLASESVTFYYGRWFEVTDATLTRHIYLGGQLIAESPIAAPASLTLAALTDAERGALLARVMSDEVRRNPTLYPEVSLGTETAAAAGAGVMLVLVVVAFLPWETRLGYFGKVRRGRVGLVVVLFSLSLTPLAHVRPAAACCGPGPPPPPSYPVYFLHTDHLGSTLALGCHKQTNGCADRTVYRYYRYSAYGQMKAYDASGTLLPATQAPTVERLYTGQVWDTRAQMYYYNARFYEPKTARFMTMDPAREYACPYAYVAWNPVAFIDPTGMVLGFSGVGAGLTQGLFWQGFYGAFPAWYTAGMRDRSSFKGGGGLQADAFGARAGAGLSGDQAAVMAVLLGVPGQSGRAEGQDAGAGGESAGGPAETAGASAVFDYLKAMLRADVLDVMGGLFGYTRGVQESLTNIAAGLATADAARIGRGLSGLAALAVPRSGSAGGLNHPGINSPVFASGSMVDNASIKHDAAATGSGFWSPGVHTQWIVDAWSGPGTQPGLYGQAYRVVGTVGFGIAAAGLWALGFR